jgi:RNA polymerase sigma-70 factor (ECF subfamily)
VGEHEVGFAESFAALWELHQEVVYQGCLSWTGGRRDDADEAFGRVALHALQKYPHRFRDAQHARAWLLTLARNVCMDLHRQRNRRKEVSLEGAPHESRPLELPAAADPESNLLAREAGLRFRAAMAVLPPRLRRPAALHFVGEMRYRDIARQLGISEVAVRKQMQQARDLLRAAAASGAAGSQPAGSDDGGLRARRSTGCRKPVLACIVVTRRDGVECDAELLLASLRSRHVGGIQKYIDTHPSGWRKRLELARALAAAGDLEAALPHYRYVLERQPFPLAVWLELGTALEILGARMEAAETYRAGAGAVGRPPDALHLRGRAERCRGNSDAARALFASAREADAQEPAHARAEAETALASGQPLDALALLKPTPGDPLASIVRHDALVALGRLHEATQPVEEGTNAAALERLIALRPSSRESAAMLRTLRRLAPERAGTQYAAALVALARGAADEAEAIICAYLIRHPRHAGARRMLADVRARI